LFSEAQRVVNHFSFLPSRRYGATACSDEYRKEECNKPAAGFIKWLISFIFISKKAMPSEKYIIHDQHAVHFFTITVIEAEVIC